MRTALDGVTSLDEDRILRALLNLVLATLRTNWFQDADAAGNPPLCVALKFDPAAIPDLPLPRPLFEIFVYSPRVEGVHLRAGRVARGGIRWSDRREDFRTEVLGLMKAQRVKNVVIVPAGAKGGFFVKRPPADPAQLRVEVEACYRLFIGALLDVTDNLVDGKVVPPPQVVRLDGDDPYLVVAADKGTAAFSDVANEIALRRGFWLGDAFASGGEHGYDHKAMGITARGAWESVRRHFRHLGLRPRPRRLHRRRHRRHVGRRLRQRDAALGAHPTRRRVRPPARVPRPESRRGPVVRRAPTTVRTAPARRGPTTTPRSSPRAGACTHAR